MRHGTHYSTAEMSSIHEGIFVMLQKAGMLRVTRKASLLAAAAQLPAAIEDVKEGTLASGYVANVTADAVFVRFLGSLTGRAGVLPSTFT